MKKIAILLLILGVVFIGLTKNVVSSEYGNKYRFNECYRNPSSKDNFGLICETDSKVCYLMGRTLLYCENK